MSSFNVTSGTVNSQLLYWSETDADRPAFIFRSCGPIPRLVLSRRHVFTYASRYAAVLRRQGIGKGDVVCNTLPNSPERLLTDLGIMMAGAASLNGMVFLVDGADLMATLQRAKCVAVITDPQQPHNALTVLKSRLVSEDDPHTLRYRLHCPEIPSLRLLLPVDCAADQQGLKPFLEELKEEEEQIVEDVQPSDVCSIMTTSGSTGFSKLVPRTHAAYLDIGQFIYRCGARDGDVFLNDRMLGWVGGAPYPLFGLTRVLTDLSTPPADPLALAWQSVKEEGVSVCGIVPFQIDALLARPELWDVADDGVMPLRVLFTGGQPARKQHAEVAGKLAEQFVSVYGSTETGFVCSNHITATNKDSFKNGDNGLPHDQYEVRIVDDNEQEITEADKLGRLQVRGGAVFTGYLGLSDSDNKACFTDDGFFRSGDVGFRDRNGHLFIVCRQGNAIIHGPFVVYPGWLEARIERCPGVKTVVVVAVPDPSLHQELCACIIPDPGVTPAVTAEDVRQYCQSIALVSEKSELSVVPRFYVFFDSYPNTSIGKTDRKAIRQIALEKLGMVDSSITADEN